MYANDIAASIEMCSRFGVAKTLNRRRDPRLREAAEYDRGLRRVGIDRISDQWVR